MSLTTIVIIITVAVSATSFNKPQLHKLMMNPVAILDHGQWYRLITSGFVHSNWMHLGFNMFTFYFFGRNVEIIFAERFGGSAGLFFIGFYLLGIVISDLPSVFKHKGNAYYNSLGASGGVAAIVFASIMYFPTQNLYLMFIPFGIPGFILGAFYLIYSYMKGKTLSDNINHDAHLFGAVYGIVFCVIIDPSVLKLFFVQIGNWLGS